jgi:hypothetical protein
MHSQGNGGVIGIFSKMNSNPSNPSEYTRFTVFACHCMSVWNIYMGTFTNRKAVYSGYVHSIRLLYVHSSHATVFLLDVDLLKISRIKFLTIPQIAGYFCAFLLQYLLQSLSIKSDWFKLSSYYFNKHCSSFTRRDEMRWISMKARFQWFYNNQMASDVQWY